MASNVNGTLYGFYYDGSDIVYKRSFDNGHSWSGAAASTGTGSLASDNFRWTIAHTVYNGTDRIVLLYYVVSGSNTNFYQKTFKALDTGLLAVSTVTSFSAANDASCTPTGTCAAAAGSGDATSTFHAAYRWKSGGSWHYKILKSGDGGSSWSTSLNTVDVTTTSNQFPITLTFLNNSTKMLFAYTTYESGDLYYRVYNGTTWGSVNTVSAGIAANTPKQISSGTVDPHFANGTSIKAYVSYLSGGNQGTLKVARFSDGLFEATETADSTLVHWLPSISVTRDNRLHIYSLYGGVIYDTMRNDTAWSPPIAPYGVSYESPDHLTAQIAGISSTGVMWRSGS
ncbi:MAG: sialidase family protein, partial [Nitrososphaera sp.]